MSADYINQIYREQLTDKEFRQLSEFIENNYGIKLPPAKKILLQSRLHKRLKALSMTTFKEYISYLFSKKGMTEEVVYMMDVVSTNKTDFFREPKHFDFIAQNVMPDLINRGIRKVNIWSAGCSTGEEPYTLAMVLTDYMKHFSGPDFSIFATDISTKVLGIAEQAIYPESRIDPVPFNFRKRYFLKSKNRDDKLVRLNSHIRSKILFRRLNFMDKSYSPPTKMDIIFCRNVLIYFERHVQEQVILRLLRNLHPHGYFFLGHSESITGMHLPLRQVSPTIYQLSI